MNSKSARGRLIQIRNLNKLHRNSIIHGWSLTLQMFTCPTLTHLSQCTTISSKIPSFPKGPRMASWSALSNTLPNMILVNREGHLQRREEMDLQRIGDLEREDHAPRRNLHPEVIHKHLFIRKRNLEKSKFNETNLPSKTNCSRKTPQALWCEHLIVQKMQWWLRRRKIWNQKPIQRSYRIKISNFKWCCNSREQTTTITDYLSQISSPVKIRTPTNRPIPQLICNPNSHKLLQRWRNPQGRKVSAGIRTSNCIQQVLWLGLDQIYYNPPMRVWSPSVHQKHCSRKGQIQMTFQIYCREYRHQISPQIWIRIWSKNIRVHIRKFHKLNCSLILSTLSSKIYSTY